MSTQSLTPDSVQLPMKGKYDGRGKNCKNLDEHNALSKKGLKPKSRKDIEGRKAITELRQMKAYKKPSEMYAEAIQAKNYSLAWQILQDVETRALGRPYVAVNPDAVERHDAADISRIAIAIKNLQIVQAPAERKASKALAAGKDQAIEAAAKPAAPR